MAEWTINEIDLLELLTVAMKVTNDAWIYGEVIDLQRMQEECRSYLYRNCDVGDSD